MSNTKRYDILTIGYKEIESAASNYAYVVAGSEDEKVDLPSAAGVGGVGILRPATNTDSYTANQEKDVTVQVAGISPFNKPTGSAVSRGDLLIAANTSGELRSWTAADGNVKVVAIAEQDSASDDTLGTCRLVEPYNAGASYVFTQTALTDDTTLTDVVPAGHMVLAIFLTETAGNAVTGGVNIGTAPAGQEVVAAEAVAGNATDVDCTLVKRLFSTTAATTFYVSDVTAWNSASVNIRIVMLDVV